MKVDMPVASVNKAFETAPVQLLDVSFKSYHWDPFS